MKPAAVSQFSSVAREELTQAQREEMFHLLASHFEGVEPDQFSRDLAEKSRVILLRRDGRLVGFSTLLAYQSSFAGEPISVVYSGDTIVTPEAWGSPALARGWITTVNQLRASHPQRRFYWLLLTSGFRTYRFLPVYWREFFPRPCASMPRDIRRLRDALAAERFGDQYDAASGIVRFRQPQRLRGALNTVPPERTADPHVDFFLRQNPGHARGDELVCLTELCPQNLTAAGRRMSSPPTRESSRDHR